MPAPADEPAVIASPQAEQVAAELVAAVEGAVAELPFGTTPDAFLPLLEALAEEEP